MPAFLTAILFLLSGTALFAESPDERAITAAVLEVSDQMTRAAQALDADRLFSFMADNSKGSIVQGGRIFLTPGQAHASVQAGFQGLSKLEYRWKQRLVTVLSPASAVLVAEGESFATTQQGDTIYTPFVQTVVFVLTGGRWKVLHAHHSTLPQ